MASEFFKAFFEGARHELQSAKGKAELKTVSIKAHKELDRLFNNVLSRSGEKIACCSGCYYCCHLKVDIQPRDAFILVDYIRKQFTEQKQAEILEKAKNNWEKIEPMATAEHFKAILPCPLLDQGNCSVYPVRPSPCRIFHSRNVKPCKESYENPALLENSEDVVPSIKIAASGAYVGTTAAFDSLGYDSQPYDLNGALVEALTNSSSEKRWRHGKRAFPKSMIAKDWRDGMQIKGDPSK